MSVRAISMALEVTGVSTRAKLVFIGLCNCADDATFTCYPGRKHLAMIGDCSVDTVDRALKELADALLIEVRPQWADEQERIPAVNLYRVFPVFDPSRKNAATREIAATGVSAETRLPSPQAAAATLAAQDAATKEPSYEPSVKQTIPLAPKKYVRPVFDAKLWTERLAQATELAGRAIRGTDPAIKQCTFLRALCEPAAGEACDWDLDVLPAIDLCAARLVAQGRLVDTWAYFEKAAVANRDRRLAGLPAPQPVNGNTPSSTRARREGWAEVIDRVVAEQEAKRVS